MHSWFSLKPRREMKLIKELVGHRLCLHLNSSASYVLGKRGWKSDLKSFNRKVMRFARKYWSQEIQGEIIIKSCCENMKSNFFKNMELYYFWRSSVSSQLKSKLLEFWFICHWCLKAHVPWARREMEAMFWLEKDILENLFWKDSHAESRFRVGHTPTLRIWLHAWKPITNNI